MAVESIVDDAVAGISSGISSGFNWVLDRLEDLIVFILEKLWDAITWIYGLIMKSIAKGITKVSGIEFNGNDVSNIGVLVGILLMPIAINWTYGPPV